MIKKSKLIHVQQEHRIIKNNMWNVQVNTFKIHKKLRIKSKQGKLRSI